MTTYNTGAESNGQCSDRLPRILASNEDIRSIMEISGEINLAANNAYDAVLCDIISAERDNEVIISAFVEHGVDDYVVKPFLPDVVNHKVMAAIEKIGCQRAGQS